MHSFSFCFHANSSSQRTRFDVTLGSSSRWRRHNASATCTQDHMSPALACLCFFARRYILMASYMWFIRTLKTCEELLSVRTDGRVRATRGSPPIKRCGSALYVLEYVDSNCNQCTSNKTIHCVGGALLWWFVARLCGFLGNNVQWAIVSQIRVEANTHL